MTTTNNTSGIPPEEYAAMTTAREQALDREKLEKFIDQMFDVERQSSSATLAAIRDGLENGTFSISSPPSGKERAPDYKAMPKTLEEFEKRLLNDPIAYTYFKMGRAVERDSTLTPEQRTEKRVNELYQAVQAGYLAELETQPPQSSTPQVCPKCNGKRYQMSSEPGNLNAVPCGECNGDGKAPQVCPECGGELKADSSIHKFGCSKLKWLDESPTGPKPAPPQVERDFTPEKER